MNYQEYLNNARTKAAQDWVNKCNTLLNDYDKYFTSFHSKDDKSIETLRSRVNYLTSQANNFRRIYEGNTEALSNIDEIVKKINSAEKDSKTSAELKKIGAQVSAQQTAALPNFSAIKNDVENTTKNTPSADALKKADRRKALFQMSGKQDINSFSNVVTSFFTDYDKKAENIAIQQKEKLMQDKAAAQWSAYRNALNEERTKVGLPSFSAEAMDSINKTMTDNMLSSTDNGYTRTKKLNNVKYNQLLFSAISSGDFQSVSESGAKKNAYNLSGDGLQEMHGVINGQQAPNSANRKYTQINDSERQVWNYYIGKEATDEAIEFIKALEPTLESRLAEKVSEEYDEQGFWGDVKELGVSAGGGLQKGIYDVGRASIGVQETLGKALGIRNTSDEFAYGMCAPTYAEKLTNAVLSDKNNADSDLFNWLLRAINSITYQMPSYALNAMGGGMTGYVLQGIGSITTEAIRNNTESVADVIYGAYTGALEWAVDKALDNIGSQLAGGGTSTLGKVLLNKIDDVITSPGVKRFLSKAAIRATTIGSENLEELIQMTTDPFARAVIYGEELDVSEITLENVVETLIITSLSTFIMSSFTTNNVYNQYQAEKIGSGIIEMGGVESLVKFAEDFDANDSDLYDRVRTAFENKSEPDPMDVVSLYSAAMENYSKFSMDDAKKIAYNIADGGNVEGVARALFNGNTEAATKFIERFSGKNDSTASAKKTKATRNRNNEYVPQFAENMEEASGVGIDNSVDNTVQNGYNNSDRGDTNVYNQGGVREGVIESAQTNARGEKKDGRNWREDEETFTARNQGNTQETGRRRRTLLKFKNQSIAYTPASSEHISDGGKTATLLNGCGIETVYVDGDIEIHENGVTRLHSQGLTTPDGKVLISSNATATDVELAAHEAVHVYDIWQTDAYINYESVIRENVRWNSDKYSEIADVINNGHYGGRYDIQDFSFSTKFIRELAAYVNQFVVTDIAWAETQFAELFDNWDAVVDASRQFNKNIGADFSESAFSMDENGVSQSSAKGVPELDISKDTRSHEERVAEMMGGKESQKVKARKFVQSIGKALGVTVVFEDTVEKYGEWSDGYIDKNGVIHIDYNNKNPLAFLFRHEMVHYGSGSKFYKQFVDLVYKSKLFREWLQEKTKMPEGTSVDRMAAKYRTMVAESRKGVEELSETRLQEEMVADFAGSDLFTAGGSDLAAMSTEFDTKQRNVVSQYIADLISWIKKKINKVSGAENLTFELSRLEDTFNRMISDANQNPTERELKHSRPANYNKSNQRIDKYGFMQDNNSRANKQGDLVNEFYNALSKKEWTTFYNEITKEGYLATAMVGTVALIVVNDKLIIAERLHRGTDAHDYVVIDAFQLQESYDVDTLELIKRKIEEGDLSYDKRTIHRTLSKLLERTFSSGILTRFDRDSQQYVVSSTEGANNAHNFNFYEDSQEGLTREGLSLRDKPGVQEDNGLLENKNKAELNNSAFSMPENIRRSVPVDTDMDTDTDTDTDVSTDFETLTSQFNNGVITKEAYMQRVAEIYDQTVNKYGRIKPGEVGKTKYQDIAVPKRIDKKTKVRRHVRTLLEGGEFTDEMVGTEKEEILRGYRNYTPVSNKKNLAYAEDAIMKGAAVGLWQRAINSDGLPTAKDIAIGEALLRLAVERGNAAEVVRYTAELSEIGTRLGQSVQALRLLKRLDGVGQLLYVKRTVDSLNRDLSKRFKGKAPIVQIDENMALRLAESKTAEDFEITYSAIMNDIAAQMPVTFLDKWNTWRYFAMLSNPKTHIRNVVGNAIFVPAVRIRYFLAAVGEQALSQDQRTKSVVIKKEYKDFAKKDASSQEVINLLKGNKYNDKTALREKQRIFKSNALEFLTRFNSDALEAEDMLFKNKHYIHAFAGFLQARNVDLNNVSQDVIDEARNYAVNEAKKATFTDESAVANLIQNFGNKNILTNLAVESVLPFKRTPINIVKRGIEYSPIGLTKTLTKGLYDVKKGNITLTEFIDGLASGLTGTGIMLVGMFLASMGCITGGEDDDDESKFEKLLGKQEYAVEIFGKSYTIDWAAPANIPFFIGVEIMNTINEGEEFSFSKMGNIVWNCLEPITNLSMLSGMQSVIESARYADSAQTLSAIITDALTSYGMQVVPSLFGAIARTIDPTQRSWYTDKNDKWFDAPTQALINNIKSKIPGLSYTQIPKIDAWGREVSRGNTTERALENFVSPGSYSEIEYSNTSEELKRIFKETDVDVFPHVAAKSFELDGETKHLTADEYVTYAKAKGTYSFDYVKEFMADSTYETLTDEEKSDVIQGLYEYANAKAKTTVSDYDLMKRYKTVTLWEQKGRSAVDYYISKVIKK